jgi:hypothetical protein
MFSVKFLEMLRAFILDCTAGFVKHTLCASYSICVALYIRYRSQFTLHTSRFILHSSEFIISETISFIFINSS